MSVWEGKMWNFWKPKERRDGDGVAFGISLSLVWICAQLVDVLKYINRNCSISTVLDLFMKKKSWYYGVSAASCLTKLCSMCFLIILNCGYGNRYRSKQGSSNPNKAFTYFDLLWLYFHDACSYFCYGWKIMLICMFFAEYI